MPVRVLAAAVAGATVTEAATVGSSEMLSAEWPAGGVNTQRADGKEEG